MEKIIGRIAEPSTWAGLAGLLLALATLFPAYSGSISAVAGFCGAVAAALREKGGTPPANQSPG